MPKTGGAMQFQHRPSDLSFSEKKNKRFYADPVFDPFHKRLPVKRYMGKKMFW
jgi:hypothetical protein